MHCQIVGVASLTNLVMSVMLATDFSKTITECPFVFSWLLLLGIGSNQVVVY